MKKTSSSQSRAQAPTNFVRFALPKIRQSATLKARHTPWAALSRVIAACMILLWAPPPLLTSANAVGPATEAVPEPADYRRDDYRSPVPMTLKGARTVTEVDVETLLAKDPNLLLIDVYPRAPKPKNLPKGTIWRDPIHRTMDGAHWLPNVGYGVLSPDLEAYFKTHLTRLTAASKETPVVFFCLRDCWMSWNAAKRAVEWGYTDVLWFRDGTDAWQEAGHELVKAQKIE